MASFEIAYKRTLSFEGGEKETDDPDDPGGRTKFGIAENYWPAYWMAGTPDESDAYAFYLEEFWNKMHGDRIGDQLVANEIFDTAVNCGNSTHRYVQECLNRLTESIGSIGEIAVDGKIGPITIKAINSFCKNRDWRDALLAALDYRQAERYWNGNSKYRRGWFANRVGGHHSS